MDEPNALFQQRKQHLEALRAAGVDPFRARFTPDLGCGEARARYEAGTLGETETLGVAGRVTAHRDMGKSHFLDLRDGSGRLQVYVQRQGVGDAAFELLKLLDLGDFVGVRGTLFRTRTGEPSLKAATLVPLAKALRPLPAKWHGLEDTETRYRQRYLDLIANEEVRRVFQLRPAIVRAIRDFFHSRGYIEVETPILQGVPGGAAAQPFKTWHNALGCEFHLRIALELYLKRLLVGGMDRVFEIGRNFRNEGLSRRHNPEFTMLEAYQAYGDYETMMEVVQSLIQHVAQGVLGTLQIVPAAGAGSGRPVIDLRTWHRARYKDLVRAAVRDRTNGAVPDWFVLDTAERRRVAVDTLRLGGDIASGYEDFEVTGAVFEKLVEPTLVQPTFVTHLPRELVPLAKLSAEDPDCVEVFECCINGQEIAPGYTEQNDPIEQRERLEHQAGGEIQKLDEDFLTALEHGMPPAGGIGIGIDRLCVMLLGQESIRDVILFPQMKARQAPAAPDGSPGA